MNKETIEEIIELSETYGDKAIYEALDTLERERRFLDRFIYMVGLLFTVFF